MTPPPTADDASLAAAAAHLTETVARRLPVEALPRFKEALRRLFTTGLDAEAATELSRLVAPHLDEAATWELPLPDGRTLRHGVHHGTYRIALGGEGSEADLFARAFDGPVIPEPTPHPAKVRFTFGGDPAPGTWFLADHPASDPRAQRLLEEPMVSDVMVAGHFVTVGLVPGESWATHLDHILDLATGLFAAGTPTSEPSTRDEILASTGDGAADTDLHLTDPNTTAGRERLLRAVSTGTTAERKMAVAVLAEADDREVSEAALRSGFSDRSPAVRRVAVDAARHESVRDLLESALASSDSWLRWRALRNLAEIGAGSSMSAIVALGDDPDFQVRFEVARITRGEALER